MYRCNSLRKKNPKTGYKIYTGHKLTAVFNPFDLAASSLRSWWFTVTYVADVSGWSLSVDWNTLGEEYSETVATCWSEWSETHQEPFWSCAAAVQLLQTQCSAKSEHRLRYKLHLWLMLQAPCEGNNASLWLFGWQMPFLCISFALLWTSPERTINNL